MYLTPTISLDCTILCFFYTFELCVVFAAGGVRIPKSMGHFCIDFRDRLWLTAHLFFVWVVDIISIIINDIDVFERFDNKERRHEKEFFMTTWFAAMLIGSMLLCFALVSGSPTAYSRFVRSAAATVGCFSLVMWLGIYSLHNVHFTFFPFLMLSTTTLGWLWTRDSLLEKEQDKFLEELRA